MEFASSSLDQNRLHFSSSSLDTSKDGEAYNIGEMDQALLLFLDDEQQLTVSIFPSGPMNGEPSSSTSMPSLGLVSEAEDRSSQPSMDLSKPRNEPAQPSKPVKREGNSKRPISASQQDAKSSDPKTLRRLVQNREAARKSRLKKKAYVQQLESSRMRLTQLEQELQRARAHGLYLGGNAIIGDQGLLPNTNSEAAMFDMEYGRWLEEHHILTEDLRRGLLDHLPENELRLHVDNYLAHFDHIIQLKSIFAKSDVFHLISGAWKTPAERFFLWIGGSRPSELIKIIMSQMEAMTEQQVIGIYGLQKSTVEAEESLSRGLESLASSLSETLISDSLALPPNADHYMAQMAAAIHKLSTLQGFVIQADNLRYQTLHRIQQMLNTYQAARCFVAIAEYFHRLRALSSLWLVRPRQD